MKLSKTDVMGGYHHSKLKSLYMEMGVLMFTAPKEYSGTEYIDFMEFLKYFTMYLDNLDRTTNYEFLTTVTKGINKYVRNDLSY